MINSENEEKIRVLVVDDSFFIRTYLRELLRGHSNIEVVGLAASGEDAVVLVKSLKPHVVTMDYHLPGKNGIETVAEIMLGDRPLPVIIMVSAFTGSDGVRTKKMIESSGAYAIAKPSGEVSLDLEKISDSLVQKILDVGRIEVKMRKSLKRNKHHAISNEQFTSKIIPLRGVVIIGASTGGPPLVEHLLSALDPHLGISVVVVQHMSDYFTSLFSERLNRVTPFIVREAKDGDTFVSGEVLVAPGGSTLYPLPGDNSSPGKITVQKNALHSPEVAIDNAMITVSECYHGPIVGVILSGMGEDGTEGLKAIRIRGGLSLAQDPKTSTVSGMPKHAIEEAHAEMVELEDLPEYITSFILRSVNPAST